ncbi:MAG: hypothetical protein ACFFA6_10790 [Promethearchaeota archaeon]
MIFKIKVKTDKKKNEKIIIAWIQKHKDFEKDLQELLQFFKNQITYSIKSRINEYYRITSNNPAIMLSLISSIHDLIAETYFNAEESLQVQEPLNIKD